ncbi:MAG: hypothetical protein RLZZ136_12 [Pseudomonadota bacterium]|jgi:iron complex outermembrane receptor protein
MRKYAMFLLASVAFIPQAAFAEDAAVAVSSDETAATDNTAIVVYGTGQTHQVQELKTADLTILAPGTSPLKAIEKLPSVNFQSADPFGAYEWSTRVTIRGFNQNQLGFTLDGIPLGDMSYGNYNGLHISRAVSSDNIGSVRVSQGAGSLGTQSTNNLGGTLEFITMDPQDGFHVDANATYGSSNTMRSFVRLSGGQAGGARGFVSVHYQNADKWKGDGKQRTMMVNAKGVAPVGAATVDAYFSYSDRAEQDYQDLSLEMINRLGYNWDNFGPSNYALALRVADIGANRGDTGSTPLNAAAGTVYPAPITSVDDAYYDGSGLRRDMLAALGLTAPLGDTVTFKSKLYYHMNDGQGTWATPYTNSPTGVPMAVRTTEYNIERLGFFGSLNAKLGAHDLTVGGWYENNDFEQARRFYAFTSRTNPGLDQLKFMKNPFYTQWDINFNTETTQYYVEDSISLGAATVNLGWKGFSVDINAKPLVQGGRTIGQVKTTDWFQPHAGVTFKLNSSVEAFAGFTQATRAFAGATTAGVFSSSQAGFDAIRTTLKPEESETYESGLRYRNGTFNGVVAAYYVNFSNRLLAIPTSVGIVGAVNALQNVGSVRAMGFEAAGDLKVGNGFSLFASYSYNDTTYRDDVVDATGTRVATAGKSVVDTPKHLLRGEVAYDSDKLFGRVGVNYMSERFFTYTNDKSVPGRAIVDATLGYRLNLGNDHKVELQLNATNLFGLNYVSTIGSNGFGNSGDNQTLLAGAPRQFFVTLKTGL